MPPMRAWKSRARSPSAASLPLRAGAQMALGARRLHVLPTPISSFLACAPTEGGGRGAGARAAARKPLDAHEDARRVCAPSMASRTRRRRSPVSPRSRPATTPRPRSNGCCNMALPKCWCCRAMRRARRASTSTGPTKPCAARRSPCPRACCAMCRAEAVYLGIVPEGSRPRAAPRRCASCSTRAPKRSSVTASRCAPNSPSARRSPKSRAISRPAPRRCWCSASPTSRRPAAPIAACSRRSRAGRCSSSTGRRTSDARMSPEIAA